MRGAAISTVIDAVWGVDVIRTLTLSAWAALPLIGLVSSPSSANGVALSMNPSTAPELTAPSNNAFANSFSTTKGKGIGDDGMFYFTLSSPAFVSISFSGFSDSDIKNNPNLNLGGAVLSLCDITCQEDWKGLQPTATTSRWRITSPGPAASGRKASSFLSRPSIFRRRVGGCPPILAAPNMNFASTALRKRQVRIPIMAP